MCVDRRKQRQLDHIIIAAKRYRAGYDYFRSAGELYRQSADWDFDGSGKDIYRSSRLRFAGLLIFGVARRRVGVFEWGEWYIQRILRAALRMACYQ